MRRRHPPADHGGVGKPTQLHPPLRARIAGYAYPVVVAVVALSLDAGFTWASRTETASRGMDGILGWSAGMGMPIVRR